MLRHSTRQALQLLKRKSALQSWSKYQVLARSMTSVSLFVRKDTFPHETLTQTQGVKYRAFSSGPMNGNGGDNEDPFKSSDSPDGNGPESFQPSFALSPTHVPEHFPNVPIIALSANPLYPKFVKLLEINDPHLVKLLRQKIHLKVPYAGVFLKKVQTEEWDIPPTLDDVYDTGVFAQLSEVQDLGDRMRVILFGHRRIKIVKEFSEPEAKEADEVKASSGGRRKRNGNSLNNFLRRRRAFSGNPSIEEEEAPKSEVETEFKSPTGVLMVETINLDNEAFQNTPEIKALCAEIVKSIRDIIQINPIYKENVMAMLASGQRIAENPVYLSDLGAALSNSADPEEHQVRSNLHF